MGLLKALMRFGGIAAILLGIAFIWFGGLGLEPTKLVYEIDISFQGVGFITVLTPQEGFRIFSTVGIVMLLGGIALAYFGGLWSTPLHMLGKVRLGLLVFSTAFLTFYAIYAPFLFVFRFTPLRWFVVIMIAFTFFTAVVIVSDQIFRRFIS